MEGQDLYQFAKEVAISEVCPVSNHPATAYEIAQVKALTAYGYRVLKRWAAAQPGAASDADIKGKCEAVDRLCAMCVADCPIANR